MKVSRRNKKTRHRHRENTIIINNMHYMVVGHMREEQMANKTVETASERMEMKQQHHQH